MTIDLDRVRADTPACSDVLFLGSAGSSLMPTPILDAQTEFLNLEACVGGYRALEIKAEPVTRCYASLARLLNCEPGEVAITENATVSWNMVFHGLGLSAGDRVLTAETEYVSNYISFLQLKERNGIEIVPVPSTETGELCVDAMRDLIDDRVKLIAVTHVPSNGGLVNPAQEIGEIARVAGIPFLLDACQSVGQIDIDVEAVGCDFLSASGRKFLRGPRGTGFLYIRSTMLDRIQPPFLDMRGAHWVAPDRYELTDGARRFENWEFNYASVIGLGAAVDYALNLDLREIEARTRMLAAQLRERLASIAGITVHDLGKNPCGIVTFSHAQSPAAEIVQELLEHDVLVSVSKRFGAHLDSIRRNLPNMVRASPHYFNTETELERFATVTERIVSRS
jgi:selenocysteine lyase/cysteine desulfurase